MVDTTQRWDAILIGWSLLEGRLHGAIYADSKQRLPDGEPIVSSTVSSITRDMRAGGQLIAQTRNTRYLLA